MKDNFNLMKTTTTKTTLNRTQLPSEFHSTVLFIERKELDVNSARALVDSRRFPKDFTIIV